MDLRPSPPIDDHHNNVTNISHGVKDDRWDLSHDEWIYKYDIRVSEERFGAKREWPEKQEWMKAGTVLDPAQFWR